MGKGRGKEGEREREGREEWEMLVPGENNKTKQKAFLEYTLLQVGVIRGARVLFLLLGRH
jgi:hypothetical protein